MDLFFVLFLRSGKLLFSGCLCAFFFDELFDSGFLHLYLSSSPVTLFSGETFVLVLIQQLLQFFLLCLEEHLLLTELLLLLLCELLGMHFRDL